MLILSLDSSTEAATAAILNEEKLLGEITYNYKKQHSVILMPMIDTLMQNLQLDKSSLDGFVVSKGPGSFTGLRIGAATIKGLSHGLNKPFVGVSTLDALAWNMAYTPGIVCPILDALRGNVYTSLYNFEDGKLNRLENYEVISIDDLIIKLEKKNCPLCFIGDAVPIFKNKLKERLKDISFAPVHLNTVKASALGELGLNLLKEGIKDDIYSFTPMYLVASQAEREYAKKTANRSNE